MSSLFGRLLRSPFDNPQVPMTAANVNWFLDLLGGGSRTESNEVVTPLTAMQTSTVFACVRILSEQVGKTPLNTFEKLTQGKGKQLALDLPVYDLLELAPNPEMTAMSFKQAVTAQALLWGAGYAEIQRNGGGQPIALWPRGAWATKPVRKGNQLAFECTEGGATRYIAPEDMLYLPYLTLDGITGLSPIAYARQTIGMNLAMDKFGARFFGNYAMPKVAIETDRPMKPEDKTQARQDWEALQSGANQHRTAILDNGMKVKALSIPPEDAQFLESRAFTKREICAMFGVPPQMLADLEKAIKSTTEQQGIEFLQYTLSAHFERWVQEVRRKLLPRQGANARRYTASFDVSDLLRPDAGTRQGYYQSGIQNGYLTQDEVREMEDRNPYPGELGSTPAIQLNMQPLDRLNDPAPMLVNPPKGNENLNEN